MWERLKKANHRLPSNSELETNKKTTLKIQAK